MEKSWWYNWNIKIRKRMENYKNGELSNEEIK